jgi:hypothetical protein
MSSFSLVVAVVVVAVVVVATAVAVDVAVGAEATEEERCFRCQQTMKKVDHFHCLHVLFILWTISNSFPFSLLPRKAY